MNALGIVSLYGTSASGSLSYVVSGVSATGNRVITGFNYSADFTFDPLTNNSNEIIGGHELQHVQTCTVEWIPTGISGSANTSNDAISEMALPSFVTLVTLSGFRESYSGEVNHSWLYMGKGGRTERRDGKTVVTMPLITFDANYISSAYMATRTQITS